MAYDGSYEGRAEASDVRVYGKVQRKGCLKRKRSVEREAEEKAKKGRGREESISQPALQT